MMEYWTNFAKTGNLNGQGTRSWEGYSLINPYRQELSVEVKRSALNFEYLCELLENKIEKE